MQFKWIVTWVWPLNFSSIQAIFKGRLFSSMDHVTNSVFDWGGVYFTNFGIFVIKEKGAVGEIRASSLAVFQSLNAFQVIQKSKLETTVIFTEILENDKYWERFLISWIILIANKQCCWTRDSTYVTFIIRSNTESSNTLISGRGDGISVLSTIVLKIGNGSFEKLAVIGCPIVHEPFAAFGVQVIAEMLAGLGIIDGTDFLFLKRQVWLMSGGVPYV